MHQILFYQKILYILKENIQNLYIKNVQIAFIFYDKLIDNN